MHKRSKQKTKINHLLEWMLYMIGYTLVLIVVEVCFDSFYIDNSFFCLWAFLAAVIIYILNKTVKPIIVFLTLPLTGLTMGLFYFVINMIILKICDWILMEHFNLSNIFYTFIIAILIAGLNLLMESLVIEPLIRLKERKNTRKRRK